MSPLHKVFILFNSFRDVNMLCPQMSITQYKKKKEKKKERFRSAICPLQPAVLCLKSGQLGFKFDTKKQF